MRHNGYISLLLLDVSKSILLYPDFHVVAYLYIYIMVKQLVNTSIFANFEVYTFDIDTIQGRVQQSCKTRIDSFGKIPHHTTYGKCVK